LKLASSSLLKKKTAPLKLLGCWLVLPCTVAHLWPCIMQCPRCHHS